MARQIYRIERLLSLNQFYLRRRVNLFALLSRNFECGFDVLAALADAFVKSFAHIVVGQVVTGFFVPLLDLDHILARIGLFQHALGALGYPCNGFFLLFLGISRMDGEQTNQPSNGKNGRNGSFHENPLLRLLVALLPLHYKQGPNVSSLLPTGTAT
jgi:hypothetical protein